MIQTLADLLDAVRRKEAEALDRYDIQHPTIIGSMYEGLTKSLIEATVFDGLDLRIADGKIRGIDGKLSGQIDCMLVHGDGELIPYTNSYVYPAEQVLVVIEVKKKLYSADLRDAYSNLRNLHPLSKSSDKELGLARSAFRTIARMDARIEDLPTLSYEMQMLFYSLARDQLAPALVVAGYFGFQTEHSLRGALINYLRHELDEAAHKGEHKVEGFGPMSFPSLILCRESALVKLNAMPYSSQILNTFRLAPEGDDGSGWWPFYGSVTGRNALVLLEVIWTRLRSWFDLPASIFGEDLDFEVINPLLFAKPVHTKGWMFVSYEPPASSLVSMTGEWAPIAVTEAQGTALAYLSKRSEIDLHSDSDFLDFAEVSVGDAEQFVRDLQSTGLVFVDNDRRLRFLTDGCDVVFMPDGSVAAGENATGRLTRWALRQTGRFRPGSVQPSGSDPTTVPSFLVRESKLSHRD